MKDIADAVLCPKFDLAVCAMGTVIYSSQFKLSLPVLIIVLLRTRQLMHRMHRSLKLIVQP